MRRSTLASMLLLILVNALAACSSPARSAPQEAAAGDPAADTQSNGTTIVLSEISDSPSETAQNFEKLANYLVEHLQEQGVTAAEIKVAPDLDTMAKWMRSGEVDVYFDSPYPAMIVNDLAAAEPILRRWKDGVSEYNSIIFAREDSGITSLDGLAGQVIGMEESFSTSGFFLPVAHLIEQGFAVAQVPSAKAQVAKDKLGYTFTNSEENTVQWVLSGKVPAGAIDSATFQKIPKESRSQLTILAETERVARHMVMVRRNLDPGLQAAIKSLLLQLDDTPEGEETLQAFEETKKFDEFPIASSLARMRVLYHLVAKTQGSPLNIGQ